MEQSTLQEILGVEREIREQLDAERDKASLWLEATRREIEASHQAELARLAGVSQCGENAAREAAEAGAAHVLEAARKAVGAVENLRDDELVPRVRECISVIIPEAVRAR
ncbi:MAG: hypothetical protein FIB04_04415 [Gammaproteobacteria bacterium]|nr:hypothetical protein [Gammaproteobacteria bacterium]